MMLFHVVSFLVLGRMNWCWFWVNIQSFVNLQAASNFSQGIGKARTLIHQKSQVSSLSPLGNMRLAASMNWLPPRVVPALPVGFSSCLAFFQLCECMRRALNALKPIGPDQRRTVEEFWFWLLRLCLHHCYGIQRTLKCVSMCCGFRVLL